MNYAEVLVYWYLRLNGFFLIENFVLHSSNSRKKSADADLLGIRLPHVYETIGGQEQDWDYKKFQLWNIDLSKDYLAVIVQVKSGQNPKKDKVMRAFNYERLVSAVKRCGMFPCSMASEIANKLEMLPKVHQNEWTIIKLAVLEKTIKGPWYILYFSEMESFIINRLKAYSNEKYRDRIFFPDHLIQYIAWKQGINI
ncbi:hypothetical protein [Neomoorella thermoacetica]|uniref:hypothetical protein n=1 Tax=Neomoorella thermoacetica TaxID=1525 RepID=UPI0008FB3F17|nr:hypothetical protein [Moorella thermoacetica]OIQ60533.1 hypothetical protein MTIN_18800 [Moorella thermoacetica]